MAEITFIIPIGPAHQTIAQRAVASIAAQTVPCEFKAALDTEHVGPGALRNQMVAETETPFVSFLDADDYIEPTFAEETLAAYRGLDTPHYIFTDWLDNRGQVVQTPCLNGPDGYPISVPSQKPYCGGTWHVLTTLLPTAWVRAVGGFDAQLPGMEDTDFYLRLCAAGYCGFHLNRALFHYAANGGRALTFLQRPDHEQVKATIMQRYGGRMGCCGDEQQASLPVGERQAGDVLAMAKWRGNRSETGRVTRRIYPRISYPRTAWVDPRDVAQSPLLWTAVPQQPSGDLQRIARAGLASITASAPVAAPDKPVAAPDKPDVSRVLRLGQKAKEPIFIFPAKDYPSYSDIKQLVALSGFDSATMIDAFSRRPLVIVSPEGLPDLTGIQARVICWQLEYAGDYAHNYDGFTGEFWASDATWAEQHQAHYVLMGSHPDLAETQVSDPIYDVTMLAYMTPRRQSIKATLSDLQWPQDYPGAERGQVLSTTRLMVHVHQHDAAPFVAPQRIAVAAAHHMPIVSEATPGLGALTSYIAQANYADLPSAVRTALGNPAALRPLAERLHQFLCVERTFRTCVMEALEA